jgi:hypothetical protein
MTSDIGIEYPKAPGLTLEQAKELGERIKKMKDELDKDNFVSYLDWQDKVKSHS